MADPSDNYKGICQANERPRVL
ncbi:bde47710-17fe-40bb-87ba-d7cbea820293 [Thermothielavioides terrestris]|uniref:Bde47710-17fe-40bb-87ba-d7cbea820293 n=1 Tax=Thermothielavioides terrestris TaxID=2587410 RepID=A0A3S4D7Z9_9PEZI|nr:bde47710-17fe-40bb-87ba-d7cbea820293 [Thermothielavioides terrestris]